MKKSELTLCAVCKKGLMHDSNITFYRVAVVHMVVDVGAVKRQAGLEMQIGALAEVMGPNEDLAKPASNTGSMCLCLNCAMDTPVAMLFEYQCETPEDK